VAQEVKHTSSKLKALSSNPSTTKKEKRKYSRGPTVPKGEEMFPERTKSTREIFQFDHFKDELTTWRHED
jgi:hypothetical protein